MQLTENPRVVVSGQPGVYCFEPISGTGKTYLYNVLLNAHPDSVVLVTYRDSMVVTFTGNEPKFVLCDRADHYRYDEDFMELLKQYRHTCVVCVDAKNQDGLSDTACAIIEVDPSTGIEVDCIV